MVVYADKLIKQQMYRYDSVSGTYVEVEEMEADNSDNPPKNSIEETGIINPDNPPKDPVIKRRKGIAKYGGYI